jgi:restriction system protein
MGYAVETIGASDDWSIDLIASKSPDGYKTAIQCKNYSKPVGDKAVLEVYAGMSHYWCDIGAVVTNNTFTKSASELAEGIDIILCEHSKIDELDLAIDGQMEILSESLGPGLRMEDDIPGMFEDFRL